MKILRVFRRLNRISNQARTLEIRTAGFWYIALTIAIGVTALVTGNNTLYLVLSFMLAGLIVSGVLSEHVVSRTDIRVFRGECFADEKPKDWVEIYNRSRFPIYFVEVLEQNDYRDPESDLLVRVPFVGPRERMRIQSERLYAKRGPRQSHALWVATDFPFGWTRKLRRIEDGFQGTVWPRKQAVPLILEGDDGASAFEGEIRPKVPEDDLKWVVWKKTEIAGDWYVRKTQPDRQEVIYDLDLRKEDGLERVFSVLAYNIDRSRFHSEVKLRIQERAGHRMIFGATNALDYLAGYAR